MFHSKQKNYEFVLFISKTEEKMKMIKIIALIISISFLAGCFETIQNKEILKTCEDTNINELTPTLESNRLLVINDTENFCFPVTHGFEYNANNWGEARVNKNFRGKCHSGIDLKTRGKEFSGEVIAMTEGIVLSKTNRFTTCTDGISSKTRSGEKELVGALVIYDNQHDLTYLYGEINNGFLENIEPGDQIQRGQKLGIASKCSGLHLEIYQGKGIDRGQKNIYQGQNKKGWYVFDEYNLPSLQAGKNSCRQKQYINILKDTESKLLDPTDFLEKIKNNNCTTEAIVVEICPDIDDEIIAGNWIQTTDQQSTIINIQTIKNSDLCLN
jgi:murein DD-endopeptidase MepM/ murein hydrolase activator NlpD